MGFNTLYALWLLPLLGLIILMYLLKEEHEEMEISSLYLWKTVLAQSEVKKPWQKLKNNMLMILQLLAAFFIIMSLANPFLKTGSALGGNIIIVIDNSGSMNTLLEGKSRLQRAKSMAENVVREAPGNSAYTIISASREAKIEISNTRDKAEALIKIKDIETSNFKGNLENHGSVIKAIYNQYQEAAVLAYTDELFAMDGTNCQIINLGSNGENAGITNISGSIEDEDYTILVRVTNTGDSIISREVALYGDEEFLGLQEVEIEPKSSENLYFFNIQNDYSYIMAELSQEDLLMEDNKAFLILQNTKVKKALLITKGNVFLEKALSSIDGIELYKTDNFDIKDDTYDLYIFDGKGPKELPKGGSLLFINPGSDSPPFFTIVGSERGGIAHFSNNTTNKYIEDYSFIVNSAKIIKKPLWADSLISMGDDILGGIGKLDGRKASYISFDVRESDLPLSPAFPIFIYNIIASLGDLESKGAGYYQSGENIDLMFAPDIGEAYITLPSGDREEISNSLLPYGFSGTKETGIYSLSYKKGEEEDSRLFAVNFPEEESKNAFTEWYGSVNENIELKGYNGGFDLEKPLIIIVLMILLAEWMVYVRGN